MAWFGDSLSSLSNLKGQITNFTKEVSDTILSDGIIEKIDERSKALKEANERCSQLQDILSAKDAEITLLRQQNCELQKTILEINTKSEESNNPNQDETERVFWDPYIDNRNAESQNQLQEQLAQATVKIRELECELKCVQKVNKESLKDDISEGHQKAEVLRAKQDMMNRIIQIEEKTRETERNAKHIQLDEATLTDDFRSVISKLNSREKFDLINGALKALQIENEIFDKVKDRKMSDEELKKVGDAEYNPLALKHHYDANLQQSRSNNTIQEFSVDMEEIQSLHKRIEELKNENEDLLNAIENLDEQHTQSIEKLLSLRVEADEKHRILQNAYEQLSLEYNESQKKIIDNELKLDRNTSVEMNYQSVQMNDIAESNRPTEIVSSQDIDAISKTSILDDIAQKLKALLKNDIISNVEAEESVFEPITKQYIDAKLDTLEKKIIKITRELKESEEIKDGLQIECEELQSHIDSLLLENQVLKSNLPCIPEASEERVASLETDVESLREEIKYLVTENQILRETSSIVVAQSKEEFSTNHDHLQENVNRKVHSSVEEDEKRLVPLEKISLNENAISTEQFDHENIRQNLSESNIKFCSLSLEDNLASLQVTSGLQVDRLMEENKDLLQKNKYLDMQLKTLQEHNLQEKNNYLLNDLQKQFDVANSENSKLLDDILCKEKELYEMQIQINVKQCEIEKLNQDNNTLRNTNTSLLEQLNAVQDETNDKIEMLNTEMVILQDDLKQKTLIYKEELMQVKKKLHEAQENYTKLENEYHILRLQYEQHETKKKNIQSEYSSNQMSRIEKFESESNLENSVTKEMDLLRNKCKLLEREIQSLHAKEQLPKFQGDMRAETISANTNKTNEKIKRLTLEDLVGVEGNVVEHVKMEQQNLVTESMGEVFNESERKFVTIIDKERQEKEILRVHNEKLLCEVTELRNKFQITFENNKNSVEIGKKNIEDLSQLIREKDEELNILRTEINRVKEIIIQISNELTTVKNQKDEFEQLVTVKHYENLQNQNEIQKLMQHINEQAIRFQDLISQQTTNETQEQCLKNLQESDNHNKINEASDQSKQNNDIMILTEKCGTLETALMQEQSNNRILENRLIESQNKEANSAKNLERLRKHLVEVESNYTHEALTADTYRQELETRLLQAEEKVRNSSTAFTSANIRAKQQVETLEEQIVLITKQKDHIQTKLSAAENKILLQSTSLINLQEVLEQFQQDKERDIKLVTEKIQSQLNESHKKQNEFLNEISILKQQLSEAKECLQAASRLSEQLEKKEEQIARLNEEVAQLTTSLNFAEQKMKEILERDEVKVDKMLIKNLLLGYLSSTTSDKSSILRVFANVLDFTEPEKEKTGLNGTAQYRPSYNGKNSMALLKNEEASLSTAFVRFLESESKPKPQLPALPIAASASSRPGYNKPQSLSSSSSSSSTSSLSSSAQSTLLLSNVALPTFPDFVPIRNTGSILKEVLKDI